MISRSDECIKSNLPVVLIWWEVTFSTILPAFSCLPNPIDVYPNSVYERKDLVSISHAVLLILLVDCVGSLWCVPSIAHDVYKIESIKNDNHLNHDTFSSWSDHNINLPISRPWWRFQFTIFTVSSPCKHNFSRLVIKLHPSPNTSFSHFFSHSGFCWRWKNEK